jgi:SAM-dependent methyltransferase
MKQIEYWNEQAGAGWVENSDALEPINGPAGGHALHLARAAAGEVVLDVGCGTGGRSFDLARAVGPGGSVTGIDLCAPMIAEARRQRDKLDLHWVDFVEDAIETAPLAEASVDLVFSQMCLMLLDDVAAGLTNLHRSLKPGARLVATAFRGADENPWLPLVVLGTAPYVGELPPLPQPSEPGPFRFADPAVPRALLAEAGFNDIEIVAVDTPVTPHGHAADVAAVLIQLGPAGGPYRRSSRADQSAARAAVAGLLARFADERGRLTLPTATWAISARRAAA